ncbi:MAG TPA: hypothetical protein VNT23_06010 [Gaiellaceae bacterium]|nr:hypothetical protein [Gaiellaceae bacterium]
MRPLARCGGIVAYLAALLLVDTQVALEGQLALGALTWAALAWVLLPETALVRAQTLVVVCARTSGVSRSRSQPSTSQVSTPSASCPGSPARVSTRSSAAR